VIVAQPAAGVTPTGRTFPALARAPDRFWHAMSEHGPGAGRRIEWIDTLRGATVLLIVSFHATGLQRFGRGRVPKIVVWFNQMSDPDQRDPSREASIGSRAVHEVASARDRDVLHRSVGRGEPVALVDSDGPRAAPRRIENREDERIGDGHPRDPDLLSSALGVVARAHPRVAVERRTTGSGGSRQRRAALRRT
jgi:hypothetical protein